MARRRLMAGAAGATVAGAAAIAGTGATAATDEARALYADPEGRVLDPVQGLPDLQARRVRFIEDADARIREDYLRILRFYRFSAWYADPAPGFDAETLAAIAANLDGLGTLSAERVGQEMRKLLAAADPVFAVAGMAQTGVLGQLLPGADPRFLGPLIAGDEALELETKNLFKLWSHACQRPS